MTNIADQERNHVEAVLSHRARCHENVSAHNVHGNPTTPSPAGPPAQVRAATANTGTPVSAIPSPASSTSPALHRDPVSAQLTTAIPTVSAAQTVVPNKGLAKAPPTDVPPRKSAVQQAEVRRANSATIKAANRPAPKPEERPLDRAVN